MRTTIRRMLALAAVLVFALAAPARADEIWVMPTYQQDAGGLGIGSNTFWPVTATGIVRLAWAVPNDLRTFLSAKIALIPHAADSPSTLNIYVCPALNSNPVNGGCAGPFPHSFTAVANQLVEVEIGAELASRIGTAGANYLAVVAYTTPTKATDHIIGLRFAYTPKPPSGVATLGANTFTGAQTATAFIGDGAGLTNLPIPSGVATLGANAFTGTQTAPAFVGSGAGLTNLPVPSGVATLGSNTFTGTQAIGSGNLELDNSSATSGILTKGGVRFLHNYGFGNTFLGQNAGNVSMSGSFNAGNGYRALSNNTTGSQNVAVGPQSLSSNASGDFNVAIGTNSQLQNTTGSANTAVGDGALLQTTGSGNVAVGYAAGNNATTGVGNIYLGADVLGVAGESNTMYLGMQGMQTRTFIAGIRGATPGNPDAMPVVIDSAGQLGTAALGALATLGANTFSGTQTAPAFVGSGAGLTNLPVPSGVATLGANTFSGAQTAPAFFGSGAGLTNLPIPSGVATLGANTFTGRQTFNAGNLDLDLSTATTGNITKNGVLFLHNYGTNNTFLGLNAGNVSMSGLANTASGDHALHDTTSGGGNTANGQWSLASNTTGDSNTALGTLSLWQNTTGTHNTAAGSEALSRNTTGGHNVAIGAAALASNAAGLGNVANGVAALLNNLGDNNVAVGNFAGGYATTGSNNIYLGANVVGGVAGESNTMYLGLQGTQTRTFIAGIRGTTPGNPDALPVVIDSAGQMGTAAAGALATLGANTFSGTQTAPAFVGDGSGLTSLPVPTGVASLGSNTFTGTQNMSGQKIVNLGAPTFASDAASKAYVDAAFVSIPGGNPNYIQNGATPQSASFNITGNATLGGNLELAGNVTKNGDTFLHNDGAGNTVLGLSAGNVSMSGTSNTASGFNALRFLTSGAANTASGVNALHSNETGSYNTASGYSALMQNADGIQNTAIGNGALQTNTSGSYNTAIGADTFTYKSTGDDNVAVGHNAGSFSSDGSNNIYLGAGVRGAFGESNTMYLGLQGTLTKTFIAGIRGITTVNADAIPVMIDSSGQLGTVSSSRRFKEDIHDMADTSRRVLQLRPVTFRYTQPFVNGAKPIQYGLIAEEVAEVFPELAVRNADGQVETVHYETLNVLLLNELQKQQTRLEEQYDEQQRQERRIEALEKLLNELLSEREADRAARH